MAAADVVVSRAGAMTLSELALMGKASVLIPFPYAAENHQYLNAKAQADAGAAVLVTQDTLEEGSLTAALSLLISDDGRRRSIEENVKAFANPDANRLIWKDIQSICKK